MDGLGIDSGAEALVESTTLTHDEAARNAVAAHLKLAHKVLGRAQTIANTAGHHSLGYRLQQARGCIGGIQAEFDVDSNRAGGRR